jgi:hypothetical protein
MIYTYIECDSFAEAIQEAAKYRNAVTLEIETEPTYTDAAELLLDAAGEVVNKWVVTVTVDVTQEASE